MAAVAQSRIQDDIHPLLRHPMPIKRDFAKAQRMLGLVAQDEETLRTLQREKSLTTRWLERPMYEHLLHSDPDFDTEEADDVPKADSVHDEKGLEADVHTLLRPASFSPAATVSIKPTITVDTLSVKKRSEPLKRSRPISYNVQHLTVPDWTLSPNTTSPTTQRPRPLSLQANRSHSRQSSGSSIGSVQLASQGTYTDKWMASPIDCGMNMRSEQHASFQQQDSATLDRLTAGPPRPRPTSSATYSHQRNRSNSKIASSRGFRNNSYPNFSRPMSGIAPRPIPGEQMETEVVSQRSNDDKLEPMSPVSPMSGAWNGFQVGDDDNKAEKKRRNRWSAIPDTLKRFARRRSSATAQEPPKVEIKVEAFRRMNVTENNLPYYESHANQSPITPITPNKSGSNLLPTPVYSPIGIKNTLFGTPLPMPFAPWAGGPPSPASSMDKSSTSSSSSLSPTMRSAPSRLSVESVSKVRPASLHSRNSLVVPSPTGTAPQPRYSLVEIPVSPCASSPRASRRGTPSLERTCIICKAPKSPADFISRRITQNCWHETATCMACLQSWAETCIKTQGLDRCTCPECGEVMANEDVNALTNNATFSG